MMLQASHLSLNLAPCKAFEAVAKGETQNKHGQIKERRALESSLKGIVRIDAKADELAAEIMENGHALSQPVQGRFTQEFFDNVALMGPESVPGRDRGRIVLHKLSKTLGL